MNNIFMKNTLSKVKLWQNSIGLFFPQLFDVWLNKKESLIVLFLPWICVSLLFRFKYVKKLLLYIGI